MIKTILALCAVTVSYCQTPTHKVEPLTPSEISELKAAQANLKNTEDKIKKAHGDTGQGFFGNSAMSLGCSPISYVTGEIWSEYILLTTNTLWPCQSTFNGTYSFPITSKTK